MNPGKPNVIIVITDDQGYGDLACHGNPIIKTPYIDKFHAASLRLENFHVGPTCAPTRAGLMTGRYCNATGVWHTINGRSLLRGDEITIADYFKKGGYTTGHFGKWHLGDNYPSRPQDKGFDVAYYHGGGGVGQTPDYWGNKYFGDTYFHNGEPVKTEGYCTDTWFDFALDFIEENRERPFLCYLSTNAPHSPFHVPPKYSDMYKGSVPDNRANFYGMISCIDENFGKLRAKLAELELEENTVLIFMTDNGTAGGCNADGNGFLQDGFNAGLRGKKGSPYDGGHRVPFFLRWPAGGFSEAKDVHKLTAHIDVLPTLCELCGIAGPGAGQVHGKSILPLLKGEGGWPERTIVTDSQRVDQPVKWKQSATMTDNWRLVNGAELYDISKDPGQEKDIAKEHPDVVKELREDYEDWWDTVSERFDEENPIIIGNAVQSEVNLTTHDLFNQFNDTAWHQVHVRAGKRCAGHWTVDVAADGEYEFELRRWPKEEDEEMTSGLDGELGNQYHNEGGMALPIESVKIDVGGVVQEKELKDGERSVSFSFALKKGVTQVVAELSDDREKPFSAYYVYVRTNQVPKQRDQSS